MKASEALLIGATKVKGQLAGELYCEVTDTACAMGCILIGAGVFKDEEALIRTHQRLDRRDDLKRINNAFTKYSVKYGVSIADDNDGNGMTFEQIAGRLEAIGE